ncbi:hypothetical protein ACC758_40010, partial [Rhizobium ruizarguesonis]
MTISMTGRRPALLAWAVANRLIAGHARSMRQSSQNPALQQLDRNVEKREMQEIWIDYLNAL